MNELLNKVKIEFTYLPVISFAMQQNRVMVIRQLSVENLTQETLKEVKICITTEPDFGNVTPIVIESLAAGATVRIDSFNINLSTDYFAQSTERSAGSFIVELFSGDESVFRQAYPIDILAYDQWSGISILPEMLAAFVTPNHTALTPIIKRAATILEQWTGSPSLDEYQSRNPDRVKKQMAAIYTAIAEQNIIYSTVPASFEDNGQRVRLADAVMAQKLGTCLDMALLYASCLEAIGIHSLLIVINGHAFAGGWLIAETFPDQINDDISLLTKRTADGINEIVLVETTCMNTGNQTDFDNAVRIANSKLTAIADFIFALDVKRARFSGIRPIPQRIRNRQAWELCEDKTEKANKQAAPESINPYDLSLVNTEIVVTKQMLWERKLLDLSLRNNLLNIRITKNTLQLIPADLASFEDALAEGEEFRILPKPSDWENPLYDFGLYQSLRDSDPIIELIRSELTQKRLRSYLSENDLSKALTHLYRSSHLSIEENGANTLYLALGLLKWYETPSSERPRYAPILLLPVEIIRKSAAKGFVIRSREEETMMNITLLEMLRQNFGISISGLDPLPADESGVNVRLIYTIIRNSIKNQRKWDVEEQAILGIFSFNKFIMWNDIHNNSHKLTKNKIVSSLLNGKIEWDADPEMADAAVLDKQLSPDEIVLPINADSSQLEAIYEAIHDKTFILHGPPGTGKSQTITNIIANALYKGKRVLFVAEKMAALSVVQNRLAAIGLAPFCLEIHSNKTKKTAVISQLKQTSEVVKVVPPEDFKKESERLLALRKELNVYVEALHKTYPFGISLYDAITRYQSINAGNGFDIPQSYLAHLDKDTLLAWQEAIEMLVRTSNACGHPHGHPLSGTSIPAYSAVIKDEAAANLSTAINLLSQIKPRLIAFRQLFGESALAYNRQEIQILSALAIKLLHIPELTPELLTSARPDELLDEYREVCSHGKKRDELKSATEAVFSKNIITIRATELLTRWNQAAGQWFLPRYFARKKVRKELAGYALAPIPPESITDTLKQIILLQEETEYITGYSAQLTTLFGKSGRGGSEEWEIILQIIEATGDIHSFILSLAKDIAQASQLRESLARELSGGIQAFKSVHGQSLNELNDLLTDLSETENRLSDTLGINTAQLYADAIDWTDKAEYQLKEWLTNLDELKDWYQWLSVRRKLEALCIGFIADEYKEKNIPTTQMPDIFNKSFYGAAIRYIISQEPTLELFKGKIFNDIIHKYKQLTADFEKLTRQEIYARLASNLPSFTREATQNSEVGILQKNLRNNARGISIRKLFDQIPALLSRMCPCMLMSPISVAQYIDPDADQFDLIVFDEASQMPTYEAVGAIARGKNIVIVGDPKQMPPTNFFTTNSVDEDHIAMEDLDSILDDCLALSIPSKYLLWHYRSKHESLIAFSNAEYYDNKLLTFPSPDNIESKVRLIPVTGYYDKGKSRQNMAEARAVVDEIARRLQDCELRKRSIGVVTFSSVQQTLIEDLLSDLFVFNPDLETLALECEEPLFIKNLENVQGDERDIILFSVGYGPDSNGRVSMNFGPLNREGGERRLNVAVSRARYEMIIYSTLRSDMLDLNKTSAIGVAGLKRFLEYAEKGERIAKSSYRVSQPGIASIENIIATRLRSLGYTVHTDIGSSGYKIDIGIIDPENPSRYKLGILCDGDNYKRTKTVRDREIVQHSVLKMLGWNICHIWTMDWWENPDEVISCILEALNHPQEATAKVIRPAQAKALTTYTNASVPPVEIKPNLRVYQTAQINRVFYPTEAFFSPDKQKLIMSQIQKVMDNEAPISRSLLCKRILSVWGIARMGQRLDASFNALLREAGYYQTEKEGFIFLWNTKEQCDTYTFYRPDSGRDAADLPPQEVANGIKQLVTDEISLPTSDLSRVCAQLFGFARSGSNVEAAIHRGIEEAVRKEYIRIENGRAMIC